MKKKNAENVSKKLKSLYKGRGDEIKEKRRKTFKKFGVDSCTLFDSSKIQDKVKSTIKEKYGVENPYQIQKNIDKRL